MKHLHEKGNVRKIAHVGKGSLTHRITALNLDDVSYFYSERTPLCSGGGKVLDDEVQQFVVGVCMTAYACLYTVPQMPQLALDGVCYESEHFSVIHGRTSSDPTLYTHELCVDRETYISVARP